MQIWRTNAEIKIAIQAYSGQYYAFPRTAWLSEKTNSFPSELTRRNT